MFQKMKSRKGFTLIEMLVVIAIIAILVAIVIPVVSNSTSKAAAAANAANLRSMKAEAVTLLLTGSADSSTNVSVSYDTNGKAVVTATTAAPDAKKVGDCQDGWKAFFYVTDSGDVIPYYASAAASGAPTTCTIEYFANIAENGDGK